MYVHLSGWGKGKRSSASGEETDQLPWWDSVQVMEIIPGTRLFNHTQSLGYVVKGNQGRQGALQSGIYEHHGSSGHIIIGSYKWQCKRENQTTEIQWGVHSRELTGIRGAVRTAEITYTPDHVQIESCKPTGISSSQLQIINTSGIRSNVLRLNNNNRLNCSLRFITVIEEAVCLGFILMTWRTTYVDFITMIQGTSCFEFINVNIKKRNIKNVLLGRQRPRLRNTGLFPIGWRGGGGDKAEKEL